MTRFGSALALAALIALTACGQSGGNTRGKPRSESNSAGSMMILHHGNAAEPGTLDPDLALLENEISIIGDMLMGLTTEDADGKPIPGAATSWDTSADGLTWTFHIRDHVWSDGTPVTSQDFLFAWRRILDPKMASPYAYFLYPIKNAQSVNTGKIPGTQLGVSAPDDKTLVVHLEHPVPYMTEFMTHNSTFPVPRHVVESKGKDWLKPGNYVANGAFILKDWVPNDQVTLVKNPKFYDAANVKLDQVIYYPTTDYPAALKRFRAGELDIQDRISPTQADWVRANMPNVWNPTPYLSVTYQSLNFKRKPLDDLRVRQALNLATDRDTISGKIRKLGEPPAYGFVPPGTANYPGNIVLDFKSLPYPERVKRAQALMQQAGFGPNTRLKLTYSLRATSPDQLPAAAAIQENWRAIYVDVRIEQNDFATAMAKFGQGDFDVAEVAWGADFNDASNFLDLMRINNGSNYGRYSNPAYDRLLDQASNEPDIAKRGVLMAQAEKLLLDDVGIVPMFFWVSPVITQTYVKGWKPNVRDKHLSRWISIER